jgi:hypothetical protein
MAPKVLKAPAAARAHSSRGAVLELGRLALRGSGLALLRDDAGVCVEELPAQRLVGLSLTV